MRLSTLYQSLTGEERAELARKVETDPGYLHQLATRWRGKRASLTFMNKLAEADSRLTVRDMAEEFAEAPPSEKAGA